MDELDAESFRARIARIPPQFKPRRLSAVPRQETDAPKVEMEYMRTEAPEAAAIREEDLRLEATAPEIEAQDAPLVLREIASGAKEEEPILDRVEMIAPSAMGLADSLGIASMDLLRLVDLARANKDHAAVIRDCFGDLLCHSGIHERQLCEAIGLTKRIQSSSIVSSFECHWWC